MNSNIMGLIGTSLIAGFFGTLLSAHVFRELFFNVVHFNSAVIIEKGSAVVSASG